MKIYESGWIDLKKTIEYITRGTICNTMENFENFVQEGLQNGFPQLYRYIYKDYRGNIRINKNVFKHAEEVVQYLPFILKLDECTEYGIYFGNTLAETFEFTRDNSRCAYNITIRPLYALACTDGTPQADLKAHGTTLKRESVAVQ